MSLFVDRSCCCCCSWYVRCTLGFEFAVRGVSHVQVVLQEERVLELVLWLTNGQASGAADASFMCCIVHHNSRLVIISPYPVSTLHSGFVTKVVLVLLLLLLSIDNVEWLTDSGHRWRELDWLSKAQIDRSISISSPVHDLQCQCHSQYTKAVHHESNRQCYFVRNQIRKEFFNTEREAKKSTWSWTNWHFNQRHLGVATKIELIDHWDKEHDWVFGAISVSFAKSDSMGCCCCCEKSVRGGQKLLNSCVWQLICQ